MEALKIYNELINYEEKNMISKQLIRLSLYLNRFSSLIRFCMENYDFLERSNTIESQIIKAYLAYKNGNLDFPIQDFMRRLSDTDEFSVLSYVVAQMVEDKVLKKDYLKEIIKRKPRHLGALAELARLGEPLSLLELTDIYQNDDSLFEHYFKKSKGSNRKLDFTFTPLGGGDDIGASCYLLQLGKQNFLIDAGIKLKRGSEEYPDFEKLETLCPLKELTMVIITHAHLDHCGGILELYKRNKNLTFVMTRQTKELLRVNLGANQGMESYYLLEELLQSSIILNFNQPLRIGQEGMTMELYPAGHILGAAALWIQSPQGNIFMTSDYCLRNQYTVQGFQVEDLPVDVLITETTYGNRKQCNTFLTNQAEQELVDYVIEKINQGKKVLIPAFAIGRKIGRAHV